MRIAKYCILTIIAQCTIAVAMMKAANGQSKEEVVLLYEKGDYKTAAEKASMLISKIYESKMTDRLTYTEYDIMKNLESGKQLLQKAYRERKAEGFFIEENEELSTLHLYLARCYRKQEKYDYALNNYVQALRYRIIKPQRDDVIFFEIAELYRDANYPDAYARMLEAAYELNPTKPEYSLKLGLALSKTNQKKKSIFHLERYIRAAGEVDDPQLFLVLGNLYEDTGRYLDTVENYKKYLAKKPEDGYIHFALGYLAYKRTGNFSLARNSFLEAKKFLPEDDILRRSKINEYLGDIHLKDLEFEKAAEAYKSTAKYQEEILADIRMKIDEIKKIQEEIKKIKATVTKKDEQGLDVYTRQDKKGELELKRKQQEYLFTKLNAGKVRWNLAYSYERMGNLDEAIQYYKQAIDFDYNATGAREKIRKLQLKIKRGY
ncbi:MAG: tetratricopeptide repeat protein [Spirochaetes bacterium]|nr:tetratricopeptide repeat protein [Spirochaetota bacterium]